MLSTILIWFWTNILTWLAKKLNLSWTYMAMIIALVGWTVYYLLKNYYQVQLQEVITFVAGVYAMSQLVFWLLKKLGIMEKLDNLGKPLVQWKKS